MAIVGLPGNPVAAFVCATLFLQPLVRALSGDPSPRPVPQNAMLGRDWPENDRRQDYLRAALTLSDNGDLIATPFAQQDSSLLSVLAAADCLVLRAPLAPAAREGDRCTILPLRK
jgi:molybdopterin molybdotransferase